MKGRYLTESDIGEMVTKVKGTGSRCDLSYVGTCYILKNIGIENGVPTFYEVDSPCESSKIITGQRYLENWRLYTEKLDKKLEWYCNRIKKESK